MVMTMRILVGNLSSETTRTDLRDLFAEFGQIARVGLAKDRADGTSPGFGLVEMNKEAEGKRAITALSGMLFKERTLKVREARPRDGRKNSNGES